MYVCMYVYAYTEELTNAYWYNMVRMIMETREPIVLPYAHSQCESDLYITSHVHRYLDNNFITSLPAGIFQGLTGLKYL
jgi:hypothetical protein